MICGIGILGFAHGHVSTYCQQWREADHGLRLVVGWDHDAKRNAEACAKFDLQPADCAEAVLSHPAVEAVVIGAETSRHAELCEQAAAAGKRIVLQKPMALTMAEADRIVAAAAKAPFTLAWQMRTDPQNQQMKKLVQDGVIGRVLMVRRRHGLSTHVWDGFENSWHANPALNRGMWADDASHAIDFLLWLLGEPKSVMADIDTLVNPKVPDDQGIAIYRYADGTFAEIVSSFTCVAGENTTEIIGERGVIIQNYGDAPSCNAPRPPGGIGLKWFVHGDSQWQVSDVETPTKHGARIAALGEPLASFLRGECPPIATAEEGRTALRMTLACYESSRLGRRVAIREL